MKLIMHVQTSTFNIGNMDFVQHLLKLTAMEI